MRLSGAGPEFPAGLLSAGAISIEKIHRLSDNLFTFEKVTINFLVESTN